MRAISAVDAVSIAIQRTRDFLFRPFDWGTYLKLGLVAMITEGFGSNFHSSSGGNHPSGHGPVINSPFDIPPVWIAMIIAGLLLAFVVSMAVYYLITRLRFAYFHCLIHNIRQIGPGWRLYAEQATRFFWVNVVVGICFLLSIGLIAIPFVSGFMRLFQEMKAGGPTDVGLILSLVLPLIPVILLLVVVGVMTDVVLRDWMLPHFALENATAGEAWSRVWAHIMAEKRQFIAYVLLRLILPTIAVIGLFFLLAIPGLILAGSLAVVEFGLHSAFSGTSGSSAVVGILLQIFFGVLGVVFAMLAGICLGGPVSTGVREYALVFYGGRYPKLGDILYPPSPLQRPTPGTSQFA
jgi:hypothetical protein